MTRSISKPILTEIPDSVISEFDLGPIRIIGCKRIKDSKAGHYVLSIAAAESIIQIVVSGGGQNARIMRDGVELITPE